MAIRGNRPQGITVWVTAREAFWLALEALRSHKLRSFLTLLGVVIATATLIVVMSVVNGMNLYIADHIANLGTNTFVLHQFQWAQGFDSFLEARRRNKAIRLDEYEYLRDNLHGYQSIGALGTLEPNPPARYKGHTIDEIELKAVTPGFADVGREKIEFGRYINDTDYQHNARVCVIGADLVEKLFPGVDPIGKEVSLAGLPFRVIGTAERVGSTFGQSEDNYAFVPLSTFRAIWMGRPEILVFIKAPDGPHMIELEDEVRVADARPPPRSLPRERHVRHQRLRHADERLEGSHRHHLRRHHRAGGGVHGGGRNRDHEHHAGERYGAHS